jgi:hypothetical protein
VSIIRYETENGIFDFDAEIVIEKLTRYAKEEHIEEAIELLDIISPPAGDLVHIPEDFQFIVQVIFNLIMEEKGDVRCKKCGKIWQPQNLKIISLGKGKSPFDVRMSEEKRENMDLFQKNQKLSGVFGGKCYVCPKDHELISMIIWQD